jgi:DNA-binding MarR family transcriptional regulator
MTTYRSFFSAAIALETVLWNAVDRRMTQAGAIRLGRLEYLRLLHSADGARVQDIVDALGTTVGAASKLTDRLVADRLVERMPHPTDRRSSLVQLTAAGRAALETGEAAFDEAIRVVCGPVDTIVMESLTSQLHSARQSLAGSGASR